MRDVRGRSLQFRRSGSALAGGNAEIDGTNFDTDVGHVIGGTGWHRQLVAGAIPGKAFGVSWQRVN